MTLGVACAPTRHAPVSPAAHRAVTAAVVEMYPTHRSEVHGLLHFRPLEHGLLIRGGVAGLKSGIYGLGIREKGDCSAFDGKSAGNILVGSARKPDAPLGRLENLVFEHDGDTNVQRVEESLSLSGPDTIVGRSLVIEAWPYDPKVDPATIPLIGCGVIQPE
jgi:Cu-Zn family superoxide dismutase